MSLATQVSSMSYCKRRKVGCEIVKNDGSLEIGYNGTPLGEDNECEDEAFTTKPNVIHAEENAIKKLRGATDDQMVLFVTRSPCPTCAQTIIDTNIRQVYYRDLKVRNGLHLLEQAGVTVTQIQQ